MTIEFDFRPDTIGVIERFLLKNDLRFNATYSAGMWYTRVYRDFNCRADAENADFDIAVRDTIIKAVNGEFKELLSLKQCHESIKIEETT